MAAKTLVVRLLGDSSHFQNEMNKAGKGVADVGRTMTRTITPIAAGIAVGMTSIGSSWNDARNAIVSGTGATGDALAGLMNDTKAVARQVPISFGDAGRAVAELNTRLGLTGVELQSAAVQVSNFSRVFGMDITAASADVGRLMNALDIGPDGLNGLLDKLTFAAQESGINVQSLMGYIIDAGPAFEELGFGLDETIALFSQFEASGARPQEVLGSLNIAMTRMAREGATDAAEAFDMILTSIADAPDIMAATRIAADTFGSRVGGKIAEDIRAGRFEVDGFVESMAGAEGRLDSTSREMLTMSDRFAMLRNRITGVLGPFGEIGGAIAGAVAAIGPMVFGIGTMIREFPKLKGVVKAMPPAFAALTVALIAMHGIQEAAARSARELAAAQSDVARVTTEELEAAIGPFISYIENFRGGLDNFVESNLEAAIAMRDHALASDEVRERLEAAGVSVADIEAAIDKQVAAQQRANTVSAEASGLVADLTDDLDDLGDASGDVERDTRDLIRAHQDHARGLRDAATAAEEAEAAARDYRLELVRSLPGVNSYEQSVLRLENSYADYRQSVERTTAVLEDSEATDAEKERALRDLRLEQISLTDEIGRAAAAYAEEQGAVEGSQEQVDLMVESLKAQREQYPELRNDIDAYIARLEAVPGSVETGVNVDTSGAEAALANLTRPRSVNISPTVGPGGTQAFRHTGGRVAAGRAYTTIPGETFVPDSPGRVLSREDSRRMERDRSRSELALTPAATVATFSPDDMAMLEASLTRALVSAMRQDRRSA